MTMANGVNALVSPSFPVLSLTDWLAQKFFIAHILYLHGVHQGVHCSMYTRPYDVSWDVSDEEPIARG